MTHTTRLALSVVAALTICGAASAEDGVTDDRIVFGGTNAATGPVAAVCSAAASGLQAYIKQINDKGGIAGRTIDYSTLDDGYSPQRAIGNVRRLVQQDKVFGVLGGCGTATAAAALSVLERTEVPYLFTYAGLDRLSQPPKEGVFTLVPTYPTQIATILPHAVEKTAPKTAAIFTFNIEGHEAVNDAATAILEAAGVEVLGIELMDVTSPDRSVFALKAQDLKPDLIVLNDSAPGAARFLLDLQRQNWMPKAVTGVSTLADESFLRAVGGAADGVLIAPGIVLPPSAPEASACVEGLAAYDSTTPSHFTMYGCLAGKVLEGALTAAGQDLTRDGLIAALNGMSGFDTGISGPVSFSEEKRMGLDSLYVITSEGGAFQVGETLPVRLPGE